MAYLFMLAGLIAIASSWFSIQPASDYRYEQLHERNYSDPESVSNDEWIQSEADVGMTSILLILVGVVSFIFTTGITTLIMLGLNVKKFTTVGYSLSVVWFLLGGVLHACVWLI